MGALSGVEFRRLNTIISAWICIAFGAGITLYDGSPLSLYISVPLSIGGIILLILGISIDEGEDQNRYDVENWAPRASLMPDAGRPMFRVDTTLDKPIRTSILCGKCANIVWIDGKKPKSFTCPSCEVELWVSEEE
mgnify:CR=1 FL=1|tara:strand:- start:1443 stop:1850 length:408 start_codon:yes stop_codon:yes gene_type:complete